MSDPWSPPEEAPAGRPAAPPLAGDELLPPIEPPSAGFILQLFVVPAVIVLLIVGVWLTVSWLVHRTQPKDLIQGLESGGVSRWQRASELADILRNKRYAYFRKDSEAAATLATILEREIEAAGPAGGMKDNDVNLRHFLCRALGEFEVNEGIDVLLLASETNRDPKEQWVRRGAIQAIAVRAYNLRMLNPPQPLEHPQLEPTLLRLSESDEPLIRSETAFALGQAATPACVARLEALVEDPHADTRYNAAVALGQLGNTKAIETLAEMLEPVPLPSVLEEVLPPDEKTGQAPDPLQYRINKRATIIRNAMRSARELEARNPDADLSPIISSLQQIIATDAQTLAEALISRQAVSGARSTLEILQKQGE
jgi:hypothetical protein